MISSIRFVSARGAERASTYPFGRRETGLSDAGETTAGNPLMPEGHHDRVGGTHDSTLVTATSRSQRGAENGRLTTP
ncbi:protein of unknown function [Agreia sp. COWG]|nr:protein of unknown function [Agreia sp. COWG]